MRIWSFCIAAYHNDPDRPGFVWASTAAEAVAFVRHPEANVYELPADFDYEGPEVLNPRSRPIRH